MLPSQGYHPTVRSGKNKSPGTSTIVAEGLRVATRETPPVGLSACAEARTTLLSYECLRRVPVEVVVVP